MAKEIIEQEYRLIDKVTAGFKNIASSLGGLKGNFTELNQAAELAAKGINLVSEAAAKIGDAVSGVADYEEAMRRVSIRTKATAEEQVELQQAVRDAATAVGATSEQAARALLGVAEDGYSARAAIDSLGEVLAFAKAQALGTAEAAAGLGGILDSFGERATGSVGAVADALTATAAAAGTTVGTLTKGLATLGTAAQENNLNFAQTVALMGQLATRNFEATDAAKRLATILDEFRDPATQAGEALANLGLSGAEFSTVLQRLSTDSTAATAVLETLGRKPREALLALLADGGGALQEFNVIVAQSAGATQVAADALNGTFNESLKSVIAQLDAAKVAFLTPVLKPFADALNQLAKDIAEFADSPLLANVAADIGESVAAASRRLIEFAKSFDFEEAAGNLEAFYTSSKSVLSELGAAASATANAIAGIRSAFAALQDFDVNPVQDFVDKQKLLQEQSEAVSAALESASAFAKKFADSIIGTGKAAEFSAPVLDAFGLDLQRIRISGKQAAEGIKEAGEAAMLSAGDYRALQSELARTVGELETARAAYKKAFESGADNVDEAWEAVKRVGSAVADLRKQLDNAKLATADVTAAFKELGFESQKALQESAKKGADAFQLIVEAAREGQATQADVARAFEEYAKRLADTAVLADASTKRQIAQQIELAGNVAGVRTELIRAATAGLEAGDAIENSGARAADSWTRVKAEVRDTRDSLEEAASVAEDSADRIATAAEKAAQAQRNATGAARDAVEGLVASAQQVQAYSDAMEVLIRRNEEYVSRTLEVTATLRDANKERERGIEIVREEIAVAKEQAAVAGGLGNQPRAGAQDAPAATASRGTVAESQPVTVNITGLDPTDSASWRRIVADQIVPELDRLRRLGR